MYSKKYICSTGDPLSPKLQILINICTVYTVMKYKFFQYWRYERSSRLIRNLSNCEREAWKKFRLQRDSNPWPLRCRCSALPTELWSHNCWEQVNFSGSIMPLRVIQHYSDWVCTALWVMTLWKIFAVDTQFKQLRKRSLKKTFNIVNVSFSRHAFPPPPHS